MITDDTPAATPRTDAGAALERLVAIMARLRDPKAGCPWDIEQTFASIAPYTIEEAYEVADAIERGAWDELRGELGDLLFQVVSRRYERGAIVLTSNKAYKDWAEIFNHDQTVTSAILDRLLHHASTITLAGKSYRMGKKTQP